MRTININIKQIIFNMTNTFPQCYTCVFFVFVYTVYFIFKYYFIKIQFLLLF